MNVAANGRDVVQSLTQRHSACDHWYRLRPGLRLDARLVAVVDKHLCRGLAILRAQCIRSLVNRPAGIKRRNFKNGTVGIIEVDRLEVMAVEGPFHLDTHVYQSPLPL